VAQIWVSQAKKSLGVPEKKDRLQLFVVMAVGSLVALWSIVAKKPKKAKKGGNKSN
jgi:hypothetical protein